MNSQVRNILRLISGILGLITFIPLIWHLLNGGGGASFAAFTFWTIIVGINTLVTIKEKGNFLFPLALTIGNLFTAITLLITKQFNWGIIEWITLVLVVFCIYVWLTKSKSLTITISTIAITIAGLPQLTTAWYKPETISISIWFGFLIASLFGVFAGKEWSIKESLYSSARALFYALVILLAIRMFI